MITHRVLIGGQVIEVCVARGLVVIKEEGRIIVDFPNPTPPTIERIGIRGIAVPEDEVEREARYLRAA